VRDVYIVLREKKQAIEQVRREVEALRALTPLLADDRLKARHIDVRSDRRTETASRLVPKSEFHPVAYTNLGVDGA